LAYRVGMALGITLGRACKGKPLVAIGKDTRISSDMLESALSAGLCAVGANVLQLGVMPTPAVAFLTVSANAQAGVVISASHNPFQYNGIKVFNDKGFKLPDEMEEAVERLVLADTKIPCKKGAELGEIQDGRHGSELYVQYIRSTIHEDIGDLRVCIDCSNGAASKTARRVFSYYNNNFTYMNDQPNGTNINEQCGSTDMTALQRRVVEGCYDIGIAFDGDADRCLLVDEKGQIVDGDRFMAVIATQLKAQGKLKNNGFVATVMSNLGLHKFAKEQNMKLLCADVGDRFVLETMQKNKMVLGGEQSGHIIFLEHMTTGDGQLAALQFLQILAHSNMSVSRLVKAVTQYPQILINVEGPILPADKEAVMTAPAVVQAMEQGNAMLEGEGRILLRPSGTEALIRVMVEAATAELAEQVATLVADSVKNVQKTI
ncbi:MAG: phosphoglucosamine mutase, partial [Eubacteriales bacterium]